MSVYPYDLGRYGRKVTARSVDAQAWFDRGLIWCYGLITKRRCAAFEKAAEARSRLRHGLLGHRLRGRPQLQQAMESVRPRRPQAVAGDGLDAARSGTRSCAHGASPVEQALIRPFAARYPSDDPWRGHADLERRLCRRACARSIARTGRSRRRGALRRSAHEPHAVAAVGHRTGKPAEGADTLEAIAVLEQAMAQPGGMRHPGLLHMYIHLMEMSPHPAASARAADASARPRSRCRPSVAHGDPYRRALRPIQECRRLATAAR